MQFIASSICKALRGQCRDVRKTNNTAKTSKMMAAARTQCNVYVAQRLKRMHKIYLSYQQACIEYAKVLMFSPIVKRLTAVRPFAFALAAGGFQWNDSGFSDEDIHNQIEDLIMVQRALKAQGGNGPHMIDIPEYWQNILNEPRIKMWKYPHDESGLTEYKVHGTFTDISAKMFFDIQVDIEYRKKWDDLVVKLNVVDQNCSKNEKVLQWVTRLPYPFAPREYLCIRKTFIDEEKKVMVISARAVSHPSCQPCSEYVRVSTYVSHMVIKPHKSFDDLGFDYLMTYCDDPKIVVPSRLASWVILAGIPEYINKLHDACVNLHKTCRNPPNYLMN